jgi:Uma2 family endonuclease
MSSTTSLITFAEFEQLPDAPGKRELLDGELIEMPPPELSHSELMKKVYALLLKGLHSSRVWPDHTGYRIAGGWLEPDVSITWPSQERDAKYFLRAPMIAVEILSPGEDIDRKITRYFNEGAQEVWVIDRKYKAMTVYFMRMGEVIRWPIDDEYQSKEAQVTIRVSDLFG